MESVILDFYIDDFTVTASKGEYGSLVCIFRHESLIHCTVHCLVSCKTKKYEPDFVSNKANGIRELCK